MQNDKIIEIITAAKKNIDSSTAEKYNAYKKGTPEALAYARSVNALIDALARIEYYTLEDMKNHAAKSAGRADVKKLLERVCKSAEKIRPGSPLSKDVRDADGRQIVCDGYRLYRITEPVELAAEYDGAGADSPAIRIANTIKTSDYTRELPVPTAADLKIIIAEQKAKNKASKSKCKVPAIYDFGDGFPAVNAEYLLDVINLYGENVKLTAGVNNYSMIYIEGEIGDGLICPVKKPVAAEKTA
ncbi:MAG: hypothetical protein II135_04720 [Clostridia bacterium]|nr:hypothetical protein [Clostridia bacterium]MBQ3870998.1 hypothetical protein [Clostridia bacterium]